MYNINISEVFFEVFFEDLVLMMFILGIIGKLKGCMIVYGLVSVFLNSGG